MPASPHSQADGVVRFTVTSEGKALVETVRIISVSVSLAVNAIPSARLIVADGDMPGQTFSASELDVFKPGAAITISAGYGDHGESSIFEGIVVRHGIKIIGENNARLVIECRDKAVAMTIDRKNVNYVDQKDSDILMSLLGNYSSLKADIGATTLRHKELVQYYRSDWDFALARAKANGFLVVVEDGKFSAQPPQTDAPAVLTVGYGEDLIEFDGDIDALDTWAEAPQVKSGLARARGRMKFQGSALAKVGALIELYGVGDRFNGKVFVSAVHHEMVDGDWSTDVEFGLAPARSIQRSDVMAPRDPGWLPGVSGLQVGVVTKLDADPEAENRVQVSVPMTHAAQNMVWARLAKFYGANSFGAFFIPEIGDEVVVGYLNGDPSNPVIMGSLYSCKRTPPYPLAAENNTKAIVTRCMAKIEFDDDKKSITIQTPANNKVVLSDDGKSILAQDQNNNKVELNTNGIVMDSPNDIKISAKGSITIDAVGDISVTSKADVKSSGLNVNCEAQVGFTAKGAASAELSASGQTIVQGALVMIN